MTSAPGRGRVAAMEAGTRAFRLEIDPTQTPLSGRLTPETPGDADAIGFTGWTGLAATLERLLDGERQTPLAGNHHNERETR